MHSFNNLTPRRQFFSTAVKGLLAAGSLSRFAVFGQTAGNSTKRTIDKTKGFFRTKKIGGKWFLLNPDGQPVFLRGANHYTDGTYMPMNLKEQYGSQQRWLESVRDRHQEWGFNYLPPSIGPSEHGHLVGPPEIVPGGGKKWPNPVHRTPELSPETFSRLDYPFALMLEVPKQYMAGRNLPDVFSKDFRDAVDQRCREVCEPLRDNPNLVGYHFCHNPPWHPTNKSFEYWIQDIVHSGRPAHRKWVEVMRRLYGSVELWNRTYGTPIDSFEDILEMKYPLRAYVLESKGQRDRAAFMQQVCEEWYKVYSETIRKYDPNHLLLGDRNTGHLHPIPEYALHRMSRYIDVFSTNTMGPASMFFETLQQMTPHWDGPILLADTGAGIYNGEWSKSAYQCRDLEEYDALYQSYMTAGLDHPQLIGFGWCGYYETPSHRSGLVDSRNDKPLDERIDVIKKWNHWMAREHTALFEKLNG